MCEKTISNNGHIKYTAIQNEHVQKTQLYILHMNTRYASAHLSLG